MLGRGVGSHSHGVRRSVVCYVGRTSIGPSSFLRRMTSRAMHGRMGEDEDEDENEDDREGERQAGFGDRTWPGVWRMEGWCDLTGGCEGWRRKWIGSCRVG